MFFFTFSFQIPHLSIYNSHSEQNMWKCEILLKLMQKQWYHTSIAPFNNIQYTYNQNMPCYVPWKLMDGNNIEWWCVCSVFFQIIIKHVSRICTTVILFFRLIKKRKTSTIDCVCSCSCMHEKRVFWNNINLISVSKI